MYTKFPRDETKETAVRLMLKHPYFMLAYYSMELYELPKEWGAPFNTLATNGTSMWINKDFWSALSKDQKMTAIAHELGHKMYLHVSRMGERNPAAWNIAGDHRINLDLLESGFTPLEGTFNQTPFKWCCDSKYNSPSPWTTEAIYDDIMSQAQKHTKDWKKWLKEQAKHLTDLIEFGKDGKDEKDGTIKESPKEFEARVRAELKEMAQVAKMAGNCPKWLDANISEVDHVKVNWWEVVEQILKEMHSHEYSWKRFNKKELVKTGVISPDIYSTKFGGVTIYVDCTGSCWDKLSIFNMHFKDIIKELNPAWTEVRYFQTYVMKELTQRYEHGEVDVNLQPKGGGGTNFSWLADDINSMTEKPEVVFFFTDMEGPFGTPINDLPIYFLSVSSINQAPFGQVININ